MAASFFQELKRRNVFRVAIGYIVLAWLMAQVAELLLDTFGAPDWVMKTLLAFLGLALPIVIYLAWAFELTPEGVRRESEVNRAKSITEHTGRKLDRTIIVLLLLALAWFAWDRYALREAAVQIAETSQIQAPQTETSTRPEEALPVVAVLPFKATGSDDGGFLAAGLHDDLLTRLAKLGAFRVISRTSMLEYADTTKNMRQIGEELGAGYILEGAVQAMPGRVRINAQLILAAADEHLWAEAYDHELSPENLFDVQAELAGSIANALHTELSPSDKALVEEIPTRDMAAYKAYLRGLQLSVTSGYIGTQRDHEAVAAFEEAVRVDAGFAEAWAQLSRARTRAAVDEGYDPESAEGALAALARARALKPGMLESELAWAEYLYRFEKEYIQSLEALEGLGPRATRNVEALLLMAFLERRRGHYQATYSHLQEARELAPRDPSIYLHLMSTAWQIDDCPAAEMYAATLRSLAPDSPDAQIKLAEYELECTGNSARALEIYKSLDISEFPRGTYEFYTAIKEHDTDWITKLIEWDDPYPWPFDEVWDELNTAYVSRYLLRDEASVASALNRAEALLKAKKSAPEDFANSMFALCSANLHAMRGEAEEAVRWLEEANQRFAVESKNDVFQTTGNRLGSAVVYAFAGLEDEAVGELRLMLEEPGGYRFSVFDGIPEFKPLEDHPGYIALRERYDNSQSD